MTSRAGYIAIIGAPNAGKSTLINRLCGAKVAIVTPKPQTTRRKIMGIVTKGESQLIFVDTPGVFQAKETFDKSMVAAAESASSDADILMLVVDSEKPKSDAAERALQVAKNATCEKILVLNKTDAVAKENLLALVADYTAKDNFARCFMISALNGEGVIDISNYLQNAVPEGVHLYPNDHYTDLSERELAAEITREKLFMALRQELPYGLHVETESWEEKKHGVRIQQVIFVEQEKHKKIIIGAKGALLKKIGEQARKDITRALGRPAHLFLFVKVNEKWKQQIMFPM
ncbi:MAG: GTPase Era [Rickettsiales bacterium]